MNPKNIDALMLMGRSERMRDKPFIKVGGMELFTYGYKTLTEVFARALIVCERSLEEKLKNYPDLDVVTESHEVGPLGGIYEGAKHSGAEFIFVTGCDMPLLSGRVLEFLCTLIGKDGVVVVNEKGYFEPLHSIYRRERVLDVLREILKKERKISKMIEQMDVKHISTEKLREYDERLLTLRNINTHEDIHMLEKFLIRQ
jgi:molybdopterin-guanine dinucleotide biosynthesis protein A